MAQDRIDGDFGKITLLRDKYEAVVETGYVTVAPSSKTNPKGITFMYDKNDDGTIASTETVVFKNATQDVSRLLGYEVKVVWSEGSDTIYGIYTTDNNTEYTMTWDEVEQDAKNLDKIKFYGSVYELDLNDKAAKEVEDAVGATSSGKIAAYADKGISSVDASNFDKAALSDIVTFIDNDGDGKIEAVQIKEVSVAKISYVSNSSLTSTLVGTTRTYAPSYTNSPKLEDVNVYEGIAKDDYAKVTYDYYNDKLTYEKLDLQTGTIEATRTDATGTKEIRIGGNWYKASADYTTMPTGLYTNDTVEFVAIDNLLYHVKKTDGAYGSKSLALIYNAADYSVGVDTGKVQVSMITRDGETMNVFVDKDYGWNGGAVANASAITKNSIVTYRVVDGEYRFAEIGAGNLAGFDQAGTAGAVYDGSDKFDSKDISDNAVVFVYDADTATNTPKVMSGKTFMDNAGTSNDYYANYLYNDNNGFDEVMVMAVGYNTIPTVVGSTYGVLTADAYETELDKDGYRYFNMYISGMGDVVAREKNGDTYTYTAGTVMKYELVSTESDGTITIKNVASVAPITGMVTSDGVFDTKYIGLDNVKYELDADTVYIDMDTQDNKGVAYGDEAKAKLTKADTANNTANARYVVAGGKVKFILIDSERNEIVLGTTVQSPSASTLTQILADAQSGETVTIEGAVPAGTFTNKSGVTLELADGAVITGATDLETNNSGTIKINGIVNLADNSTLTIPDAVSMPAGAGFDIANGGTLDWEDAKFSALKGVDVAFSVRCVDGDTNNLDTVIKESVTLGAGTLGSSDGGSLTVPTGVTITVASGSALKLGGNVTVEGAIDVQSGGEIRFRDDGKIAFGAAANLTNAGTKYVISGTQVKIASGNTSSIHTTIGGTTIASDGQWYKTTDSGSTWSVVS